MKTKLDTLANLAIITLCLLASIALVRNQLRSPADDGQLRRGLVIESLRPQLDTDAERTLLVAMAPKCSYCTASLPFYQRLLEARSEGVRVVGVVRQPEELDAVAAAAAHQGLRFDDLLVADFAELRVMMTPTLLLLDKRAKVVDLWLGRLQADGEREVLRAVA